MIPTPSQTYDPKTDVPTVPSTDIASPLSYQPSIRRKKMVRTALTLREKAIVKSFCEQKLTDCKARGQSVPSQEALRQEVLSQFGWSCGRSTLSKIIAMDWKLLRGSHEGGEAPRNSNMKRRRRPLFPAFEADLVNFILNHIGEEASNKIIIGAATADIEDAMYVRVPSSGTGEGRRSLLTEALILKEAQRLKQVHGICDKMLVLSVGWLARFKHRHCIRLRKPGRGANKYTMMSVESRSVVYRNDELFLAAQVKTDQRLPCYQAAVSNRDELFALSSQPQNNMDVMHGSTNPAIMALCSALWAQKERVVRSSKTMALLDRIPQSIRGLGCTCQEHDDVVGAIGGLRVAVVGHGSIVDAFLLAQAVGADGFVFCLEASPSNVNVAEQLVEEFCLRTLGLPAVNIKFIVGDYSSVNPQSSLQGNELESLRGQVDFVLCNCSTETLDFPGSKNIFLKIAFSLLKVGGELRATELVCSRRLSQSEKIEAHLEEKESDVKVKAARTLGTSIQKVLLGAPYIGDLHRMFRTLDCNSEVRIKSGSEADGVAINSAVVNLFPSLAAAGVRFRRVTFHAFRLENMEEPWEDYGQSAVFHGSEAETKADERAALSGSLRLDDTWIFQRGVRTPIDGNTAQILQKTWMQRYFSVAGNRLNHRGPFVKDAHTFSSA